jgi:hypothetical protein
VEGVVGFGLGPVEVDGMAGFGTVLACVTYRIFRIILL